MYVNLLLNTLNNISGSWECLDKGTTRQLKSMTWTLFLKIITTLIMTSQVKSNVSKMTPYWEAKSYSYSSFSQLPSLCFHLNKSLKLHEVKKFNIFIQMQAYGQGQQVYTHSHTGHKSPSTKYWWIKRN